MNRRRLCAGDGSLGFGVAQPPAGDTYVCLHLQTLSSIKVALHQFVSLLELAFYEDTVASAGSLDLRHHFSS